MQPFDVTVTNSLEIDFLKHQNAQACICFEAIWVDAVVHVCGVQTYYPNYCKSKLFILQVVTDIRQLSLKDTSMVTHASIPLSCSKF